MYIHVYSRCVPTFSNIVNSELFVFSVSTLLPGPQSARRDWHQVWQSMHVTSAYNVLLFLAPTKTGNTGTYEPIYTVNNLYNDFIILQDVFLTWKLCFWYIFYAEFGIIYKLLYWYKFPNWSLTIQHRHEHSLLTYDVIKF